MKVAIANKDFTVSIVSQTEGQVSLKLEHKGRYQTVTVQSKKAWKQITPKRAEETAKGYLAAAPAKRIANLLSYKTEKSVAAFQAKLS